MFQHELLYRGPDAAARIQSTRIVIGGCGALGANIAILLWRAGIRSADLIDNQRIDAQNIGTQPWESRDIGSRKTDALAVILHRIAGHGDIRTYCKDMEHVRGIGAAPKQIAVALDCFDNAAARGAFILNVSLPMIHVGMGNGIAEVKWEGRYTIPTDAEVVDGVCEYPLANTLVATTAALAAEAVLRYVSGSERMNADLTFNDMRIVLS